MRFRMSELYPFLLQPLFDPRPWGTLDLAPVYPNQKFEEKIGEAWLPGASVSLGERRNAGTWFKPGPGRKWHWD